MVIECGPQMSQANVGVRRTLANLCYIFKGWSGNNFLLLNFRRRSLRNGLLIALYWNLEDLAFVLVDPTLSIALNNKFSSRVANFESFRRLIYSHLFLKNKLNELESFLNDRKSTLSEI
jgi:hypothetical protein